MATTESKVTKKYQQRFSYDLLSNLACVLLDGTVFKIVSSLKEVQQLEERNLCNQRMKLLNERRSLKQDMQRKHKELLQSCQAKPHNLSIIQKRCSQETEAFTRQTTEALRRCDMEIIRKLDQQVMDQQQFLEKASVPGFSVTNNPADIKLQMYILEFISRLSQEACDD